MSERLAHRKHCFYRYGGDRPDCDCENQALKQAIGRAIDILDNDRYATRWYNAKAELQNALDEWGPPDPDLMVPE